MHVKIEKPLMWKRTVVKTTHLPFGYGGNTHSFQLRDNKLTFRRLGHAELLQNQLEEESNGNNVESTRVDFKGSA